MYNDNVGSKRSEWAFPYKGKDLLPYAQRKLDGHQTEETSLRQQMSRLIQDPATFHNDAALPQLKREIDRHSGLREQFQVYCHEFRRSPGSTSGWASPTWSSLACSRASRPEPRRGYTP